MTIKELKNELNDLDDSWDDMNIYVEDKTDDYTLLDIDKITFECDNKDNTKWAYLNIRLNIKNL